MTRSSKKVWATNVLDRIWRGPERWFGLGVVAFILFCSMTYSRTVAEHASRVLTKNKYVALVDGMLNPFRNRHILLNSGLPIYDIKIKSQAWNALLFAAEEAKTNGWMNEELKTWVPATFIHDGEVHKVEVRLRGDLSRHWSGPKKSYRIKFSDTMLDERGQKVERYFHGKRQINLVIPQDKLYALGPFVNDVLRSKGLVTPEDRFVILRVNGVIHGLYYEAEHFDKPLLAGNERPETTVFGLNTRARLFESFTELGSSGVTDANFDVGSLRRQVDPVDDLGLRAMQVLIDHARNPTPENFARVRAVLDWDKYLYYRCMTTLCNTNEMRFGSDNLKLYYDSSRGLLEPVPWDILMVKMPNQPGTFDFYDSKGTDPIDDAVLRDPELRLRRNQILWELVGDGGDSLLARYDRIAESIRLVVWADVLTTPIQAYKMDLIRQTLAHNIRRVHHVLAQGSGNLTYRLDGDELATLEFSALTASGVHLQEITLADSAAFSGSYRLYADHDDDGKLGDADPLVGESDAEDASISFILDESVLPEMKHGSDFIHARHWEYYEPMAGRRRYFLVGKLTRERRDPLLWTAPTIQVSAVNAVSEELIPSATLDQVTPVADNTIGISCYDASDPYDLEAISISLAEFLQQHPQFQASTSSPGAAELGGSVALAGTVIVPKSVPLHIAAGTDLTLEAGAAVLAYGGINCIGIAEQPIRIHGRDGAAWGTFAAVRPAQRVRIQWTEFSDGGQKQANGMLFTGGLAVHEGDLELENCRFTRMQSEDAVNIKYGDIRMSHCVIEKSASDALDIDVGTGEVHDNRFSEIRGDGIDVSFSRVTLRDNELCSIRDKGISVGEKSQPVLTNNFFRDCQIAVSCKDLAFAKVTHCTFVRNRLAIEAKRKKATFGGGAGEFVECVFAANDTLLREDIFSKGRILIKDSDMNAKADDHDLVGRVPTLESNDPPN